MALLYPWATKEYLLWEMSLGQLILYHNLGIDMKYGTDDPNSLRGKSQGELREIREEMRKQGLIERKSVAQAQSDGVKETYRSKYGDV